MKKKVNELLKSIKERYPNAYITSQESGEPKDICEIADEEHMLYDLIGIVCGDRRQYRHPLYPSMIGDCDGICITPDGTKIGIECKAYSYMYKGSYNSGVFGGEGKHKKQVYPALLHINQYKSYQ